MPLMVMPVVWVVVRESDVRLVLTPIAPFKAMEPTPAFTVKALAPLIVLLKEMALPVDAFPVEAKVRSAPKVMAPV